MTEAENSPEQLGSTDRKLSENIPILEALNVSATRMEEMPLDQRIAMLEKAFK